MATATSSKRLKRDGSKDRKSTEVQEFSTTLLLKLTGQVTVPFKGVPDSEEQVDMENRVLEKHFSDLAAINWAESSCADGNIEVVATGWKFVDCDLPFRLSTTSSAEQIDEVLESALQEAQIADWDLHEDMYSDCCEDAWVIEKRRPTIHLQLLQGLSDGDLSLKQYRMLCACNRKCIPRHVLRAC
jgi:hypothetical protein